jgi:fructokinase
LTVEPRIDVWRQRLSTWLALAHIVKVSCEDLETLYPGVDPAEVARSWLDQGTRLIVITKGGSGAVAFTQRSVVEVPARPVAVVDTVGAGDAFQAALLHSLLARGRATPKSLAALEVVELREILTFAVMAAAIACSRAGADLPTAADVQAAVWESTAA